MWVLAKNSGPKAHLAKNSGPNPRSFPKIIDKTPPEKQNLALKRAFTLLFRLHTDKMVVFVPTAV